MGRSSDRKVTLGSETYEVIPQAWPYLQHELTEFGVTIQEIEAFDSARSGDYAGAIEGLGERAHALLNIFIPDDLMPLHRWCGYATEADMEAGKYNREAARKAPAFAEIVDAFQAVFRVNKLDVVSRLKSVLPMELIQREIRVEFANLIAGRHDESPGPSGSPTLPSPSGGSPSRTSSEPSPTPPPPASEGSPSPESTSSAEAEPSD